MRTETQGPSGLPVEADAPPATGSGSRRILIIDDEVSLVRVLQRALARDHDVTAVTSGLEGLQKMADGPPFDAILCDIMMPQCTGVDVYETVCRRWPDWAERIIFMSGGTFTPQAREFRQTITNHFVEKPFELAHLRQVLQDFLAGRPSEG